MTSDEKIFQQDVSGAARVAPLLVSASNQLVTRHSSFVTAFSRPTAREWARHVGLFVLTFMTATFSGVLLAVNATDIPEPALADPAGWVDYFYYLPAYYVLSVGLLAKYALAHPELLVQGVTFAGALLSILLAHEAGHYIACRRYHVAATLPFFLPAPPLFLAGTFGAFIKIKSPIPTRRALFDIGVAGPLAGFAVIIPIAVAAVLTMQPTTLPLPAATDAGSLIYFNEQPLFRFLVWLFNVRVENSAPNPLFFAAWIGLLVTSLNLLPVGQLDGGHAVFAVCGPRAHALVGRATFVLMAASAVFGWTHHGTPSGFLYALLLLILLRVRHPQAEDEFLPLGRARLAIAALTLAVFLLSFELFPLTIA